MEHPKVDLEAQLDALFDRSDKEAIRILGEYLVWIRARDTERAKTVDI